MRLIYVPIALMLSLAIFNRIMVMGFVGDRPDELELDLIDAENWSMSSTLNDTTSTLDIEADALEITFEYLGGFWLLMLAIVSIGVGFGIQVISSGLNTTATKMAFNAVLFGTLWTMLTAFAGSLLLAIPVLGWLVYLALSLLYTFGFMDIVTGISGGRL